MNYFYIFVLAVFTIICKNTVAQNKVSCVFGDTLELQIENYRGSVSWQQSSDNQAWFDIVGSSVKLEFVPDTNTKWVRVKIEEENCPVFYEPAFIVNAIDTSVSEFTRNNHTLQFLSASLISFDNGVLKFDVNSSNFPLKAGDLLSGVSGQQNMLMIEAVISHNGRATVFVTTTNFSSIDFPINFGNSITGNVMGRVLDENGESVILSNVQIGSNSVFTDFNGAFVFNNVEMFEKIGYVKARKNGYFEGSRTFIPKSNGTVLEIRLLRKNLAGNFDSNMGGSISLENVQLQFSPNSVMRNGSVFYGNVNVFVNYIDPASSSFLNEMPGNLIGNQNGNIFGLTSFGMIAVEMQNDNGQVLEIAEGQFVTASSPLTAELLTNAPDTIDLWSFNESQGIWQDEGEAIKNGNSYVAQLPHFSFWNYDRTWDAVFLSGTVIDENNNPVSGVIVNVSAPALGSASDVTNNFGQYSGMVPANMQLDFRLDYNYCETTFNLLNLLNTGSYNRDTIKLLQVVQVPDIRYVSGSVIDCENQPLEKGYILSNNQIYFLNNGFFSFSTCLPSAPIRIVKTNPLELSEWQTLNLNIGLNDIGNLTLCGGETYVTDSITDVVGNVYNTVLIGDQLWMAENLKTFKYSNGDIIPNVTDNFAWSQFSNGAYCLYNNLTANDQVYGRLYNWYAVDDPRNICPAGWHVPSEFEWDLLATFLGGESVAGGKMKSTINWESPNTEATNSSGFSAVAAGRRINSSGAFSSLGLNAGFWSSTDVSFDINAAEARGLGNSYGFISAGHSHKKIGNSVRCVKD